MTIDRENPEHRAAALRILKRTRSCLGKCCASLTIDDVLAHGWATPDFVGLTWHCVTLQEDIREREMLRVGDWPKHED
jgi:hypothetical protein